MAKLGLVVSATYLLSTRLLGIHLICSYVASDKADRQGPCASCFSLGTRIERIIKTEGLESGLIIYNSMYMILPVIFTLVCDIFDTLENHDSIFYPEMRVYTCMKHLVTIPSACISKVKSVQIYFTRLV